MQRRFFVACGALIVLPRAFAHHGWSSFDQSRPLWLEGQVVKVEWRNPHAMLEIDLPADRRLPADLGSRVVPAQSAPVDGAALLKAAVLPTRSDRRWQVELAPISRLEAWKVVPVQAGETVAALGFTFVDEKGDALMRAEYLFAGGKVYGLRSSPA
jgi:hypothetical protein